MDLDGSSTEATTMLPCLFLFFIIQPFLVLALIDIKSSCSHAVRAIIASVVIGRKAVLHGCIHLSLRCGSSLLLCLIFLLLCDDEAHLVRVRNIIHNANHILITCVPIQEHHLEFFVHHVAFLVSNQVNILLRLHNLHVVVILTPFIELSDFLHWQDLGVAPNLVEIQIQVVAVYGKDVTDAHRIHK